MNASVNLSTLDGWIPEFASHGHNAFVVPEPNPSQPDEFRDESDRVNLLNVLENEILPIYYDYPGQWLAIVKNSMTEIASFFNSDRMADEYYRKLYSVTVKNLELEEA
jgi:starch phosphorylase